MGILKLLSYLTKSISFINLANTKTSPCGGLHHIKVRRGARNLLPIYISNCMNKHSPKPTTSKELGFLSYQFRSFAQGSF